MIETIPPVVVSVTVGRPPNEAFRIFTERLGAWWPLATHSIGVDEGGVQPVDVVLEPGAGGRIYEVAGDGSTCDWGRIRVWEPPHRLVTSWQPNRLPPNPTVVEVRFEPIEGGTRVTLEHRGWERLGDRATRARAGYEQGWPIVLTRYVAVAGADPG